MQKLAIFICLLMVVLVVIYGLLGQKSSQKLELLGSPVPSASSKMSFISNPTPIATIISTASILPKPFLSDILFTVQAPFAEWKDPRQQDACEEASVLMIMHWVKNEPILGKQAAKDEILALSKYQEDNFGNYHNTSAQDTADRLINGYYHYSNYRVKNVSNVDEIIAELNKGKAVIIPTNGQALGNPYFILPGPERHNLVLKRFDPSASQFITNDPGISQGENYHYDKNILFNAIRDYPTGDHVPIVGIKKVMIVVSRS